MLSRSTKSNAHQNSTTTWNSGATVHKFTYQYLWTCMFYKIHENSCLWILMKPQFFFTRMWFYAFGQKQLFLYFRVETTEEVCLMQCSSPLWPGRIYFLCYTCRLDSAGGHDLSSISHRTVHGAPQLYDWRTSHTTYRLLFLK